MKSNILYLKIAGFAIGLKFHKTEPPFAVEKIQLQRFKNLFPGFITKLDSAVDYWINLVQKTEYQVIINNDFKDYYINFYKQKTKKNLITYYHISDFQFFALIRNVVQSLLISQNGIYLHASAVLIKDKACLFLGKSGAGKSTAMTILSQKFTPLADDSLILKKEKGKYIFYQTPMIEKNFWIKKYSQGYPLGNFYFVKKAKNYQICKIVNKQLLAKKMSEQFLTDKQSLDKQYPQLLKIVQNLDNFYELSFSLHDNNKMLELFN